MTVYALDVDPCSGAESERSVGAATYKAGDVRNKWTWRADSTTFSKYTREYRIRASTGTRLTTNGLTTGQYVQPVTEWIFPEANVPGIVPPVNDFSQFTYLAHGLGRDDSGNLWGQLNPWPGANAPTTTSCPPASAPTPSSTSSVAVPTGTPAVSAGTDASFRPGVVASLRGSVSNTADFPTDDLKYNWTQLSGPKVTLSSLTATNPSFTVPATTAIVKCVFNLNVKSTLAGTSSSSNVTVTIDPSVKDVVTIDSYSWTTTQSGTISITAHSNVIDGTAKLTLYLSNPIGTTTPITMVSAGGGKFSYGARSVKKPATGITIVSGFGGTVTTSATTAKKMRRRGLLGFREG